MGWESAHRRDGALHAGMFPSGRAGERLPGWNGIASRADSDPAGPSVSNRLLGEALVVVHIGVVFIPRAWQRPHCMPASCPMQGEAGSRGSPGARQAVPSSLGPQGDAARSLALTKPHSVLAITAYRRSTNP